MVIPQENQQFIGCPLQNVNNSVMLASSTFLFESFRVAISPLLDFSTDALDLPISSQAALTSVVSLLMAPLSFSILDFILVSWSICSDISATASWCFLFKFIMVESCLMRASSKSFLNLPISASLFLLSSTCALVAPPASFNLSPSSSYSLAKSERFLSAFALACLSASSSSSSSSTRPWVSLIAFWILPTIDCSSSSLLARTIPSFSFLAMLFSNSFFCLSKSVTPSWVTLSSPSIFLLIFSTSPLALFSRLYESSSSSKVPSNFDLMLLKWSTLSLADSKSSEDLA